MDLTKVSKERPRTKAIQVIQTHWLLRSDIAEFEALKEAD
jgi:hypothetical protein